MRRPRGGFERRGHAHRPQAPARDAAPPKAACHRGRCEARASGPVRNCRTPRRAAWSVIAVHARPLGGPRRFPGRPALLRPSRASAFRRHRRPRTARGPRTGKMPRAAQRSRPLEGWRGSAVEPTGRNRSRQQPRLRSGYAHGGTDAHECRHVLAKQLGAVQTEGRAVRLLLPTGALHRRTDRAQGLVFPGCLPSRPASLTSPLRRGSESPPRGRTAVGRARGQLPTGGASGMGRRSDRSAGARPHGLHRRIESHGWAKGTVEQLSAHIDLRDPADVASRPRTCGACGSSSRSTRQAQDAQRC